MNTIKFAFFALVFLFAGIAFQGAANLTDSAWAGYVSADGSLLPAAGDPAYIGVRCDGCGFHVTDSCQSNAGQCVVSPCKLCPTVSEYRCDWYSCGWIRGYGCATCFY